MSTGRKAAVVVIGIVLTLTLAGGNLVFAAHSSVLDPGFVTNTLAEEDGYEALTQEMRRAVQNATEGATSGGLQDGSFGSLLEDDPIQAAVTPEYVASQVDPNVEAFYAYLHGNEQRLNLSLDTRPLAQNAGENVADSIRNATVPELVDAAPGDPFADLPVDAAFVEQLNEGPDAYQSAKEDLREQIRTQILDRLVDDAFQDASNDELLALVIPDYDPNDYSEQEKEQMVADREGEIRDALATRIENERGDEIDGMVQDQLDQFREQATGNEPNPDDVGNEEIATAVGEMEMAIVTAVTTDQSYDDYRANVTSARGDLAGAIGSYVETQITEEMGVVDLNEQLDIQETGEFDGPKTIVGYLDLSAIVLPLLALALIGGVWFLTRSVVTTATTVGVSLVIATLPAIVGGPIVGSRLRSMIDIEGEAATTMEPVVEGVIEQVIGTITGQSLLLAVVGLLFVGVGLALRYGLDETIRNKLQDEDPSA